MFNQQPLDKSRWVPVVSSTGKPLMPCHPARARQLVSKGKAIKKFCKNFFYIQLTEREDGDIQEVAIGIDPGSMREAYTVMSATRTYVNIQTHAALGKIIKKIIKARREARRARRSRKTPCRQPRWSNRSRKNWLPPSTKARWQRKLNMILFLSRLYPVTDVAIENVSVETKKGNYRHNNGFSPIQAGKNWLYKNIEDLGYRLHKYRGVETGSFRKQLGLFKTKDKLSNSFSAHCVDSWVLANAAIGNKTSVDLNTIIELIHHQFTRRQLHRFNPSKGGERKRYGGTVSLGIKKGTLCIWKDCKKYYIGGSLNKGIVSLHSIVSGKRVTQNAKLEELILISYSPWRYIDHSSSFLSKEERRLRRLHKLSTKLLQLGITNSRVLQELKTSKCVQSVT